MLFLQTDSISYNESVILYKISLHKPTLLMPSSTIQRFNYINKAIYHNHIGNLFQPNLH